MDMYIFVEYSTVQLCDLIFEYHILLQQKDVHLCNDYKSFSQLFWP